MISIISHSVVNGVKRVSVNTMITPSGTLLHALHKNSRGTTLPIINQVRGAKKNARYKPDDSRQLTIKPKAVIAQQRSRIKNTSSKNTIFFGGKTDSEYSDDIDLSQDDFHELADAVTTYGNRYSGIEANENYWRDTIAFQRVIRAKTLEQKYFRPPKKLNLLTWAAKEQLRLLHENDPEEWTVESLAKVFPVGKESIQKIIKSKVRLRRLQDILENDLYVKRNWEKILSCLRENQLDDDVKDFFENLDTIGIIPNALPSPHLPSPKIRKKENEGIFSLIVRDELERQAKENENMMAKQKQLNTVLSEILSEITDIITKEGEKVAKENIHHAQHRSLQDSSASLKALIRSRFIQVHDNVSEKSDSNTFDNDPSVLGEAPQRLSLLSQKDEHKLYSYRIDDCVYDENGEFLYRIP